MSAGKLERRQVVYRGQVQGVGFRYTTQHLAQHYAVAGFVRNMSDGSVELVVEGEPGEIDRFLAELARRMREYIRGLQVADLTATGEFSGFGVRH